MSRTIKFYIFVLVLIIIGIVIFDANKAKPIDWRTTYSVKDKIPFGLFVFDKESKKIYKSKIQKINVTPYEFFDEKYDWDSETYNINGTFFYVNHYNGIDEQSTEELMTFVSRGNTAFLSSSDFSYKLLDSLKIETKYYNYSIKDSTYTYLANSKYQKDKYNVTIGTSDIYFSKIDTLNTVVLGYQYRDSLKQKQVNFIEVPYGKGTFLLHTQPAVFTNYHLLKNKNYRYTESLLSFLPENQDVYWFTKGQTGEIINQSPLRFIASEPALRYAWYILLLTGLMFVIFNIKRKQRIVPIIKPLENTTVDFTKTIGNLYYQEKDHKTIIDKKITYFLEKIRTQYMLETKVLDEQFVKRLQLKSGKPEEDIQKVVDLINRHKKYGSASEDDLVALNRAIEKIS